MSYTAFHNDPAIKEKYLARVRAHREADNLIQGTGWENGKGCAIGCTLEVYEHSQYPIELGIPEVIARLEDGIFEGLPNHIAQDFPERVLSAITPGADLQTVGWKFLHWLLTGSGVGAFEHETVRDAISQCASVLLPLTRGEPVDDGAVESAAWSAWSAANAARSANAAAWSAANAAAWSAESAAWSAWSAANAARSAKWAELAARAAAKSAAESGRIAWEAMADRLVLLLERAQ